MKMEELNDLIKQIAQDTINRIEWEKRKRYHVKLRTSEADAECYEYYQRRIGEIKGYEIRGEPDIFIEASCVCEALIRFKCVAFDLVKLANEQWVEVPKHMGKKVAIPTGIIPNAPLRERIIRGLVCRDLGVKDFSTFEFSNTLHLIYLCNQ